MPDTGRIATAGKAIARITRAAGTLECACWLRFALIELTADARASFTERGYGDLLLDASGIRTIVGISTFHVVASP